MKYDPLFIMDTNVILCYLEELIGYKFQKDQCKETEKNELKNLFKESKIPLLLIVKEQAYRFLEKELSKGNQQSNIISNEHYSKIQKKLKETLKDENMFKNKSSNPKTSNKHHDSLRKYQKNCIEYSNQNSIHDPYKIQALDWLKKKISSLPNGKRNIDTMSDQEIKNHLGELYTDMEKNEDNEILSNSAALAKNNIVFLISHDGDLNTFDRYFRTRTDAKMWIMHPHNIKDNMKLLEKLIDQSNKTSNDPTSIVKILSILEKNGGQSKDMIKKYMKTFGWPINNFETNFDDAKNQKIITLADTKNNLEQELFVVAK